jgi:hypothetical protein
VADRILYRSATVETGEFIDLVVSTVSSRRCSQPGHKLGSEKEPAQWRKNQGSLTYQLPFNLLVFKEEMVRPERFELPTFWFVAGNRRLLPFVRRDQRLGQMSENAALAPLSRALRRRLFTRFCSVVWHS